MPQYMTEAPEFLNDVTHDSLCVFGLALNLLPATPILEGPEGRWKLAVGETHGIRIRIFPRPERAPDITTDISRHNRRHCAQEIQRTLAGMFACDDAWLDS